MKIWITGIAGFLGSHLADALIAEGHEVGGNDNLICGDSSNSQVDFYDIDCRYYDEMLDALNKFKPDVVIHCAATAHEGLSSFSPSFITKNIYEASVATFSAAIAAGVKRIVYMSSMSRYGRGCYQDLVREINKIPLEEENTVLRRDECGRITDGYVGLPFKEWAPPAPVDPYAVAKVAAEDTLKILAKTHDIQYAIAVPHNIIGTRQRYNDPMRNVASIMMNRCLQGKAPIIYGDGLQTRCFSPVADCIPSIIKMVNGEADGEIINIGPDSGEITMVKLANKIMAITGFEGESIHMPDRPNEVKHAYCSSDKARKLLGYEPKQSLDDCLAEMVADIRRKGTKEFDYSFPIEITEGCPGTWVYRLI